MGSPVTTNPLIIMFINMTVVFAVLYGLSLIIRVIKAADPTQKKTPIVSGEPELAATEAAAATRRDDEDGEAALVIAAALAAYGFGSSRVVSVRPVVSRAWLQAGRLESITNRPTGLRR